MKTQPSLSVILRREKLLAMQSGGTKAEQHVAGLKLASLDRLYDFKLTPSDEPEDIFAGKVKPSVRGEAIELFTFDPAESELASFAKWAIENGHGVRTRIRTVGKAECVAVEASVDSLPQLRRLAETIRSNFRQLWERFTIVAIVAASDQRVFYRGLYDGLMHDPRTSGTMLPAPSLPPPSRKRRAKNQTSTDKVALHPYAVALDLGAKIRLLTPVAALADEIDRLALNSIAA